MHNDVKKRSKKSTIYLYLKPSAADWFNQECRLLGLSKGDYLQQMITAARKKEVFICAKERIKRGIALPIDDGEEEECSTDA